MRKRVDLARALASDPKILLMDEPFGSLDAITKEKLQIEVTELWEKSKVTVVFITHDLEEALFLGDRIAIMQHINTNIPFKIFDVPFGRPRNIFLKEDPQFQAMRRQLIEEFKLI
jgi:NitT/TauT family transport system ATP-binding protein